MWNSLKRTGLCFVLALAVTAEAEPIMTVDGLVNKKELNVRAGAGTNYTLVGKLKKLNPVTIVGANKDWYEIVPPGNCGVWVMNQYVKNNKLTANINLRSGPGTGYEAVGYGKIGFAVEKLGPTTPSGWMLIKVPAPEVRYYVSRPAIDADKDAVAKLPPIKSKLEAPNKDLIALEGNFTSTGKAVTMTGTISPFDSGNKSLSHVLYVEKGDELVPAAYIFPGKIAVKPLNEKAVRLSGTSYTVKGWELPVVVLKSIKAK